MPEARIIVALSIDADTVWRVTRPVKKSALVRLGLKEYEAVAEAAEAELLKQIAANKKTSSSQDPSTKAKK